VNQQALRAIVGFLLLVPAAAPVAAQQPSDLPDALVRVAPGEAVTLLDTDGHRLAGRIARVSSSGLTLVQRGQTTAVPLQRVARITVTDSNRNGAIIGGLIGAAIGLAGGAALNAICVNEGGECLATVLGLTAAGAASGAGIGWLGDRVHQSVVYARPGAPREFAPELQVKFSTDSRSGMTFPGVGGSWGMTSSSGLGFEVNVDRTVGRRRGEGRGTSFDGRVRYTFGHGRYRPYVLGGAGYFQYYEAYSFVVPANRFFPERIFDGQASVHGVAPLVGGGIRFEATRKISIRPEVIWYHQPGGRGLSGLRASVGAGFQW